MSQIYKQFAGTPPPAIPTDFETDVKDNTTSGPGTVIPAANIVNLLGRDTTQNNTYGVRTDADPDNGNNLYVELTNRVRGTATVVGAVTGDIITFALAASAASYRFSIRVAGISTAGVGVGDGVGYSIEGSIKTTGAAASVVSTPDIDADEDATLTAALIDFIASGNNMIVRATGVAGATINYSATGYYTLVT